MMPRDAWPASIPMIRSVLDDGLELTAVTVLVGENGVGKSTLLEGIADAYGIGSAGGTHNSRRAADDASELGEHLQLNRGAAGYRGGVFLRAETMHDHFEYAREIRLPGRHNSQSHGESFLEFCTDRGDMKGLWLFDEAESALSFQGCLALLALIRRLVEDGSQIVLSTHSPILASLPEALIYECGEWGIKRTSYDDLEMVRHWRSFLQSPERYLHYL